MSDFWYMTSFPEQGILNFSWFLIYFIILRTRMGFWPCLMRSVCGPGPWQTRPSWTSWTLFVLIISTLKAAWAKTQSSSQTTACLIAAFASSTTLARLDTQTHIHKCCLSLDSNITLANTIICLTCILLIRLNAKHIRSCLLEKLSHLWNLR